MAIESSKLYIVYCTKCMLIYTANSVVRILFLYFVCDELLKVSLFMKVFSWYTNKLINKYIWNIWSIITIVQNNYQNIPLELNMTSLNKTTHQDYIMVNLYDSNDIQCRERIEILLKLQYDVTFLINNHQSKWMEFINNLDYLWSDYEKHIFVNRYNYLIILVLDLNVHTWLVCDS